MKGSFALLAVVALGAATHPAAAFAADDTTALRAELNALKSEYDARVAALEARIAELESAMTAATAPAPAIAEAAPVPEAAPRGASVERDRVQPGDVRDPGWQLRQPFAGPRRLPDRGIRSGRRRDRARRAQLQPRGVGTDAVGQHRSVLHGQLDRRDDARGRARGRGGVLPDACAACGTLAQGRAFLLRLRLPERVPRTRLGLRRPAARLPGVLRRSAGAGRPAAQVGCADGVLPGAGRRDRQRRGVPGDTARRQRS